jgi:hypothetical protein
VRDGPGTISSAAWMEKSVPKGLDISFYRFERLARMESLEAHPHIVASLGCVTDIPAWRGPALLVALRGFAHDPFEQYTVGYVVDTSIL